jgi:hypothetical protein
VERGQLDRGFPDRCLVGDGIARIDSLSSARVEPQQGPRLLRWFESALTGLPLAQRRASKIPLARRRPFLRGFKYSRKRLLANRGLHGIALVVLLVVVFHAWLRRHTGNSTNWREFRWQRSTTSAKGRSWWNSTAPHPPSRQFPSIHRWLRNFIGARVAKSPSTRERRFARSVATSHCAATTTRTAGRRAGRTTVVERASHRSRSAACSAWLFRPRAKRRTAIVANSKIFRTY